MKNEKCIKHNINNVEIHNADNFEFICNDCGHIIKKENKRVFEMAIEMMNFIKEMDNHFN